MAANELNLSQQSTLPPELFAQQQALNRQQQMAQLLMQQGQQQPQGQMVSGRYVPTSFFQNLAPVANMLTGAYLAKQGDTKAAELAQQLRTGRLEGQKAIMEKINAGDTKGALALATQDQYGAGKELIPALVGNVIPKTPEKVAEYNFAVQNGFKGSYNDFANQMSPYQAEMLKIEKQKLALEQGGGKLTEFQGKATNFGIQMAGSANEMAAVEKAGFDPASTKNQALLGIAGTKLGNTLVSPEVQRYKQGMDNFTENYIRFKSGANVPMHEIEKDLKNMMPEVGDTKDKLEQKQRARERALQGMAISAGPGVKFINEAYKKEAPAMLNPSAPSPSTPGVTPNLWGQATVVNK